MDCIQNITILVLELVYDFSIPECQVLEKQQKIFGRQNDMIYEWEEI